MGNGLIGTNMYRAEAPDTYRLNVGRSDVTEQREGYDLYKKGAASKKRSKKSLLP